MNKSELIDYVSEKAELTKSSASNALEAIIEAITASLKSGNPVMVPRFGSFTVKERAAREGRNPSTGEKIKIRATRVVGFKAGKDLKDAVKEDSKA